MVRVIVLVLTLFGLAAPAAAEQIKYRDDRGRIIYLEYDEYSLVEKKLDPKSREVQALMQILNQLHQESLRYLGQDNRGNRDFRYRARLSNEEVNCFAQFDLNLRLNTVRCDVGAEHFSLRRLN